MQMQFREYRKQDYRDLVEIIRKTWHYDEFCSPKTANKLANVFLSSCLTNYTYARVVIVDGKAAGIILVNNIAKHTCSAMARLRQLKALAALYCCKEQESLVASMESISIYWKRIINTIRLS